jgi:hypothetical protein
MAAQRRQRAKGTDMPDDPPVEIVAAQTPADLLTAEIVSVSVASVPALEVLPSDAVLKKLRADVDREHGQVLRAQATMLQHAVRAGQLLIQAKNSLAPGVFQKWVEQGEGVTADLSVRTAQRYMQVANNFPELIERLRERSSAARSASVSIEDLTQNVSLREAVRLIAQSSPRTQPVEKNGTRPARTKSVATPWPIVEAVARCVGSLSLDPAADTAQPNYLGAETAWTEEEDGLRADRRWFGTVFVHPSGRLKEWINRAIAEFRSGHAKTIVLLLPCLSDSDEFRLLNTFPRVFLHSRIDEFSQPAAVFLLSEKVGAQAFANAFADLGDAYVPVVTV